MRVLQVQGTGRQLAGLALPPKGGWEGRALLMALSHAHTQGDAFQWRPAVALTTRAAHQQRQASVAAVQQLPVIHRGAGPVPPTHKPTSTPLPCYHAHSRPARLD
jgi:hypothetical protein